MALVTEVIRKSSNYPIILTYQNGNYWRSLKGVKRSVEVVQDEKTRKKKIKVTYDNHSYEGDEIVSDHSRKYLVVRKASTGEVHIVEAGEANLINSLHLSKKSTAVDDGDYITRVAALQKKFGGKRSQRKTERMDKFRMNNTLNEASLLAAVNDSFDVTALNNSKIEQKVGNNDNES